MNSQLYTAASGLIAEERRVELISNNLANLSTPGYRAQRSFTAMFDRFGAQSPARIRTANAGVAIAGTWETPGPGPMEPTGRSLDVALDPGQLLTVQTEGGRAYTRAGSLAVSPDGQLVDASGRPLLNPKGKPIAGLTARASLTADGRVLDGDNELGRLNVVRYDASVLRREGDLLFSAAGNDASLEQVAEPRLQPGYVEGSGTDAMRELVDLIEAQRAFESYQRVVSLTMNTVNRRAVNDIAG